MRSMVDPRRDGAGSRSTPRGDVDHLLIGTSLPLIMAPGAALARGLERGRRDGAWGRVGQEGGGEAAPGRSTSSTGRRSSDSFRAHVRPAAARSAPGQRGEPPSTIVRALGRRPPRLPRRGRLTGPGPGVQLAGLAGGLLAVPQPARHKERRVILGACDAARARRARCWRARARRRAAAGALAARARRAVVQQPGRDARCSRAARATFLLEKAMPPPGRERRA